MKLKTKETIYNYCTINGLESLASLPSPTSGWRAGVPGLVLLLGAVPDVLGVLGGVLGGVGDQEVPPLGLELAIRRLKVVVPSAAVHNTKRVQFSRLLAAPLQQLCYPAKLLEPKEDVIFHRPGCEDGDS